MKKNILIMFTLLLVSSSSLAQYYSGVHDSLIFDGAGEITTIPTSRAEDCKLMVTYAYGSVEGTFYKTEIYNICTGEDSSNTTEKGALIQNHVLKLGEEITTGDNGNLELQFYDGSVIRMGPNSKIKITGDMCDRRTLVEQVSGKIWNSIKKLLGSQKYEVQTDKCATGVRGTEFSVETTEEGDITRVYEGSVEVRSTQSLRSDKTEDNAKEYAKLTEDYQAGRITMEEFIKKSQEYQKNINKVNENVKGKLCEAGYMITISGNVGEPVPIEPGSNWFDDENFKK